MIEIYQGQTLKFELTIVDNEGNIMSLPDSEAVFAYSRGGTVVEIEGTVTAGVFEAVLSSIETADLLGTYKGEIKVKDNSTNEIAVILKEDMVVEKSIIPDFGNS